MWGFLLAKAKTAKKCTTEKQRDSIDHFKADKCEFAHGQKITIRGIFQNSDRYLKL